MMKRSSRDSKRTKKVLENESTKEELAKKGKKDTKNRSNSPTTRSRSKEGTPTRNIYTQLLQEKKNEKNLSSCIAERTKSQKDGEPCSATVEKNSSDVQTKSSESLAENKQETINKAKTRDKSNTKQLKQLKQLKKKKKVILAKKRGRPLKQKVSPSKMSQNDSLENDGDEKSSMDNEEEGEEEIDAEESDLSVSNLDSVESNNEISSAIESNNEISTPIESNSEISSAIESNNETSIESNSEISAPMAISVTPPSKEIFLPSSFSDDDKIAPKSEKERSNASGLSENTSVLPTELTDNDFREEGSTTSEKDESDVSQSNSETAIDFSHDGSQTKRKLKQSKKKQKRQKGKFQKDVSDDCISDSLMTTDVDKTNEQLKDLVIDKTPGADVVAAPSDQVSSDYPVEENAHEDFPPDQVRYIPMNFNKDFHGILLLKQNQFVALHGYAQVGVIFGEIDISGYVTSALAHELDINYLDVYSSSTSSLLYLLDLSGGGDSSNTKDTEQVISKLSSVFGLPSDQFVELLGDLSDISSCLVVKRLYTILPKVLKKLENFQGFPHEPKFFSQPFDVAVLDTEAWNAMVNAILSEMASRSDGCLCSIMLCGVGNVGKSSLARYVVNRLLEKHDTIFFLDCDCGQTEFTPPSCISLVKITKPLLGPPFSHMHNPIASYFYGYISPGDTPSKYIEIITKLFNTYHSEHLLEGPLVINTQGWMQGLGLSLLVDCIRLTSPCHVVHITSSAGKRNVPVQLSDEMIQNEKGWHYDSFYQSVKCGHECTYHHLPVTEVQTYYSNMRRFKSRVSRDQNVSSYFSALYQPHLDCYLSKGKQFNNWNPPSMSVLWPYVVQWKDLALHIMHEKVSSDVLLFGFNMALVGLVHVDPELIKPDEGGELRLLIGQPVAKYVGFGIVRNIDPTNKLFYILTPVPKEQLSSINCMVRGSAQLPTSYFLEDVDSNRPYYCADYVNVASKTASSMKPRYNLKRKPAKVKSAE